MLGDWLGVQGGIRAAQACSGEQLLSSHPPRPAEPHSSRAGHRCGGTGTELGAGRGAHRALCLPPARDFLEPEQQGKRGQRMKGKCKNKINKIK